MLSPGLSITDWFWLNGKANFISNRFCFNGCWSCYSRSCIGWLSYDYRFRIQFYIIMPCYTICFLFLRFPSSSRISGFSMLASSVAYTDNCFNFLFWSWTRDSRSYTNYWSAFYVCSKLINSKSALRSRTCVKESWLKKALKLSATASYCIIFDYICSSIWVSTATLMCSLYLATSSSSLAHCNLICECASPIYCSKIGISALKMQLYSNSLLIYSSELLLHFKVRSWSNWDMHCLISTLLAVISSICSCKCLIFGKKTLFNSLMFSISENSSNLFWKAFTFAIVSLVFNVSFICLSCLLRAWSSSSMFLVSCSSWESLLMLLWYYCLLSLLIESWIFESWVILSFCLFCSSATKWNSLSCLAQISFRICRLGTSVLRMVHISSTSFWFAFSYSCTLARARMAWASSCLIFMAATSVFSSLIVSLTFLLEVAMPSFIRSMSAVQNPKPYSSCLTCCHSPSSFTLISSSLLGLPEPSALAPGIGLWDDCALCSLFIANYFVIPIALTSVSILSLSPLGSFVCCVCSKNLPRNYSWILVCIS